MWRTSMTLTLCCVVCSICEAGRLACHGPRCTECDDEHFECVTVNGSVCLHNNFTCDGVIDCLYGVDEKDCSKCSRNTDRRPRINDIPVLSVRVPAACHSLCLITINHALPCPVRPHVLYMSQRHDVLCCTQVSGVTCCFRLHVSTRRLPVRQRQAVHPVLMEVRRLARLSRLLGRALLS